jgi:hypothetical protein
MTPGMDKLIEAFCKWDPFSQGVFVFVLALMACGTLTSVVSSVCTALVRLLRGYPQPPQTQRQPLPVGDTRQICDHKENLSGYCLKEGGHCRTKAECDNTVDEVETNL